MMSNKNRNIAITGAFSALNVVMVITGLGYIRINPLVSYTILQVPTVLATILGGFVPGLVTGFVFGLTSWFKSAVMPVSFLDPCFLNPLCSIVPRVMFPIVTWLVFTGLKKISRNLHVLQIAAGVFAAVIGSLANTIFVFASLCLVYLGGIPLNENNSSAPLLSSNSVVIDVETDDNDIVEQDSSLILIGENSDNVSETSSPSKHDDIVEQDLSFVPIEENSDNENETLPPPITPRKRVRSIAEKAVNPPKEGEEKPVTAGVAYIAILLMFAPAALVEGGISGVITGLVLTALGAAKHGKAKLHAETDGE
ncbi:MAG: ECF transporter S component [Treponemataceae bacterium]|nr:ECF transporter S component [Treponemataceae bacterium]